MIQERAFDLSKRGSTSGCSKFEFENWTGRWLLAIDSTIEVDVTSWHTQDTMLQFCRYQTFNLQLLSVQKVYKSLKSMVSAELQHSILRVSARDVNLDCWIDREQPPSRSVFEFEFWTTACRSAFGEVKCTFLNHTQRDKLSHKN
jgi:hypothetical protein